MAKKTLTLTKKVKPSPRKIYIKNLASKTKKNG